VEVQHVEILGAAPHLLHHQHVWRDHVVNRGIQTQGARPHFVQTSRGDRVATGEQRHLVSERNQLLCQVRHHPLGAAVELRRDGFVQRSDLRNAHRRDS
jgi:hypothetical protein